ncbi:hypothetical protein BJX63DRAFT_435321 [Aspergillus granulosus]|uniref:GH18 domain-containing protein n=1 Tax=Aspergillus granulosus TaxID=176169 RepID=A0ABR4H1E0_9EURO
MDIIEEKGLAPKLYKEAGVKVVHWDNQWVAYDDEETLELKAQFALGQALGGLMVWAISHDSPSRHMAALQSIALYSHKDHIARVVWAAHILNYLTQNQMHDELQEEEHDGKLDHDSDVPSDCETDYETDQAAVLLVLETLFVGNSWTALHS